MTAPPLTYAIMLKSRGNADYKPAGHARLDAAPQRGASIAFEREGLTMSAIIDAVFIPPGCEENCVGTVFVSEG